MDSNGEIDLKEHLVRISRTIVNNSKSLILAFIIGTLMGLAYNQLAPPKYESKIIISSDMLTYSYAKGLIDDLNKLLEEHNYKLLTEKLGIPMDDVNLISHLETRPTIEKSDAILEKDKTVFSIIVNVRDVSILPKLQNGLTSYIENNEFVSRRVAQRKVYHIKMIAKTAEEIKELEKLREGILEGKSFSKGTMMFDPTTVNSKILELTKEKITLEHALELVNSIHIIEGFTQFNKPVSPKLSISLTAGASLGLLFIMLVIAIKGIRKMISLAEHSNSSQSS